VAQSSPNDFAGRCGGTHCIGSKFVAVIFPRVGGWNIYGETYNKKNELLNFEQYYDKR
jgi:hypothetical protein